MPQILSPKLRIAEIYIIPLEGDKLDDLKTLVKQLIKQYTCNVRFNYRRVTYICNFKGEYL